MIKKYISSTVLSDFKEVLKLAQELDCGVEISRLGKLDDIEKEFGNWLKKYKKDLEGFNGGLTIHGYFSGLCVAAKEPVVRDVSHKRFYQSLEAAYTLGASTVIYHTGFNNLLRHKEYQRRYVEKTTEFFEKLVKDFEREGITATIENVHESDYDSILEIINKINSPNLKGTIDFGHVNIHSQIKPEDWIKKYGELLHHMHIHGNYGDEDSHASLLKSNIDYKKIADTLKELNLKPKATFEIFKKDELVESVKYFNKLIEG